MKLYSVNFIDCKDNLPNHKLLEANSAQEVYEHMKHLGHTNINITERK